MRGKRRVVGDDEDRGCRRRRARPARASSAFRSGIDPARRLVEDEQARLDDGDRGEPEPLALAAREVARMPVCEGSRGRSASSAARARARSPPTPNATSARAVSLTR